tara:strand:- start:305 stop:502 length:198 start_codon:yes stop_codon:yes gene_type:complete
MNHKLTIKKGETCKICTCGKSKTMPICDDTHREYNQRISSNFKSLKITPSKDTELDLTSSTWEEQ